MSNYSSEDEAAETETTESYRDDAPVSPLALMNENSPEAWLGQFLLMLEIGGVTRYGTITGAKRDEDLKSRLTSIKEAGLQDIPLKLLDSGAAAKLKAQDWAAWWRAQSSLTGYCYSTLALSMLGDLSHIDDLVVMYNQEQNSRIQRDAHYVLCYMIGKEWPGHAVTLTEIQDLKSSH